MMRFLDFITRSKKKTANVAKDRLQIIVARERWRKGVRDYLPLLHQELVQVIAKYEEIDPEFIPAETDLPEEGLPGIVDVSSGSDRLSLDGTPYSEW